MGELCYGDDHMAHQHCGTGRGNNASSEIADSGEVGRRTSKFPGSQLGDPVVPATSVGHGTDQLGQGGDEEDVEEGNNDETVDERS